MSKTATTKNLNASITKKKPSILEMETRALKRKLDKLPVRPVITVPEDSYLVKKSTKELLAAQVVELTIALNAANKSIETLGIQGVVALHDLGIAKRTIKVLKKGERK